MGHIFISYSHKDKGYIEKLEAKLISEGFDSAKDALLDTLKQFLLGLARMQMQNALGGLLGKSMHEFTATSDKALREAWAAIGDEPVRLECFWRRSDPMV